MTMMNAHQMIISNNNDDKNSDYYLWLQISWTLERVRVETSDILVFQATWMDIPSFGHLIQRAIVASRCRSFLLLSVSSVILNSA